MDLHVPTPTSIAFLKKNFVSSWCLCANKRAILAGQQHFLMGTLIFFGCYI